MDQNRYGLFYSHSLTLSLSLLSPCLSYQGIDVFGRSGVIKLISHHIQKGGPNRSTKGTKKAETLKG